MDLKRVLFPVLRTIPKRFYTVKNIIRSPPCFYGESVDLEDELGTSSAKKWLERSGQPVQRRSRKRNWLVRRSPTDKWAIGAYYRVV